MVFFHQWTLLPYMDAPHVFVGRFSSEVTPVRLACGVGKIPGKRADERGRIERTFFIDTIFKKGGISIIMDFFNNIKAALLAGQHGHPRGLVGRLLGEQMVRQHVPETTWTLSLLKIQLEDQILEIGFGAGRAIELASTQAPNGNVTGIDHSQEMVRSASRRNARAIKAGRVVLHRGDVTTLPFHDNQFDKIFSIQTLYFWSDVPRALAELFRVLKPGALLVVTLSTGSIDSAEATGLEGYQQVLEEQIIPGMQQLGFTRADIAQGPLSRQFKNTAVIGVK